MNNPLNTRIESIDALRGLAMLIMLADHVREYFYLHRQVTDPMDVSQTEPTLFMARLAAHLCPTIFIFLSGVSAYLYGQHQHRDRKSLSHYLLSRGLFLVILEITVINYAWTFQWPPEMLYLQVIWAIGISMIVLAGLLWLPLSLIAAIGGLIIVGHNALAPIDFPADSSFHILWAILHDRSVVPLTETLSIRTSYPVLPWIGVMTLGYALAPTITAYCNTVKTKAFLIAGFGLLAGFVLLRASNLYGNSAPWHIYADSMQSVMSFFNITKYPASLLFLMLTSGVSCLIFAYLRHIEAQGSSAFRIMAVYGKSALFFYIVHLYVLHLLYQLARLIWGDNQGTRFGFDTIGENWLLAITLALPFYYACRLFRHFRKRPPSAWLRFL